MAPIRFLRLALLMAPGAVACSAGGERVEHLFQSPDAWIDLTHPFNGEAIYWPTAEAFELETVAEGVTEGGWYYTAYNFSGAERHQESQWKETNGSHGAPVEKKTPVA